MQNEIYSLESVSKWLLNSDKITLPAMQRGFVWKSYKIENLWDSIFRDYPIGSFMLTSEGDKLMILDGQQRATSIAFGFYNPWNEERDRIGNAKDIPIIWLDLSPQELPDNSEFLFRVTTRSHPWGYQLKHNNSILGVSDRLEAAEMYRKLYGAELYTKLKSSQRLPYEAFLPVPLCFLFESYQQPYNYESWRERLISYCNKCIPTGYYTKRLKQNSLNYHETLSQIDLTRYYEIISRIVANYYIPSIIVDNKLIVSSNDNAVNNPTLFVRLNSAGTNLEGEELIYSVFKAICPNTKDLVENIGNQIIAPSRIISLTSRLIMSMIHDKYVPGINLVMFQKEISNSSFLNQLKYFTGTNETDSKLAHLMSKAIDILKYDGSMPDVIVKRFVRESPNALLLLINWLYYNDITSVS